MVAPFNKFYGKIWVGFLSEHWKKLFLRVFILNATERAWILLKSGIRDFQNSPPFQRSACFYVTVCGNFDRFRYFNLETYFLENENLLPKTGLPLFS